MMLFTLLPDAALRASDRKTLFDSNWKFHLGIVANAEQPEYNDSHWRVLDLPHDWGALNHCLFKNKALLPVLSLA